MYDEREYADDAMLDAEIAEAEAREREQEEGWDGRQRLRQAEFDAGLDAYQEREREAAAEREALGDVEARRPDAQRFATTFDCVRVGDFMTMEDGPGARWVEVVKWAADDDAVHITFQTPQPIGVGMHQRWCIDRGKGERVTVDLAARAEG